MAEPVIWGELPWIGITRGRIAGRGVSSGPDLMRARATNQDLDRQVVDQLGGGRCHQNWSGSGRRPSFDGRNQSYRAIAVDWHHNGGPDRRERRLSGPDLMRARATHLLTRSLTAVSLWWTNAVVYQIYPRSFADSNGDGIGDLAGIESSWTTSWTSAWTFFGCRRSIDHRRTTTGTTSATTATSTRCSALADFDRLLAAVHERGMKLIMDLVVNHTSDEHPWFMESRSSRTTRSRTGTGGAPDVMTVPEQLGLYLLRRCLGVRRPHGRVLPAPVHQAAGPQLGEPAGPAGCLRPHELVAGSRGRRVPHGRDQRSPNTQPCPTGSKRQASYTATAARTTARSAGARIPAGDAPGGVRRSGRRAADSRGDAGGVSGAGPPSTPTGIGTNSTWSSSSSTWNSTTVWVNGTSIAEPRGTEGEPGEVAVRARAGRLEQPVLEQPRSARVVVPVRRRPQLLVRKRDAARYSPAFAARHALHLPGRGTGDDELPFVSIERFQDVESLNYYRQAVDGMGLDPPGWSAGQSAGDGRDNARTPVQWDDSAARGITTGTPWLPSTELPRINAAAGSG